MNRSPASIVAVPARLLLLAVGLYAPAVLWWPGYLSWGLLMAGLGAVWVLWVVCAQLDADTSIPGHPIHLALAGPAAVAVLHAVGVGNQGPVDTTGSTAGALSLSLVLQLAVVSVSVMLSQALLRPWARRWWLGLLLGAAMLASPPRALLDATYQPAHPALAGLVLCGSALLASSAAALLAGDGMHAGRLAQAASAARALGGSVLLIAACAVTGIAIAQQPAAGAALAVAAGLAVLTVRPSPRWAWMAAGAAAVAGGIALARPWSLPADAPWWRAGLIGWGDWAVPAVWGVDPGWAIVLLMTGWAGLGALAAGLAGALVLLGGRWRADAPAQRTQGAAHRTQGACWLAAALLATWATLAGGGLGIPACTLAAGMLWGLAPAAGGVSFRRRSGWIMLVLLAAVMALLGLARRDGLVAWVAFATGGRDRLLHVLAGALLTLCACWILGSRRLWAGLLAAAIVAAGGGLAEGLQGAFTRRGAQLEDWRMHLLGCAMAAGVYVLAWLWRWEWESRRRTD